MKPSDYIPPHLLDDYEAKNLEKIQKSPKFKIWPQWPSKYGPGGRRLAKAKRKKK